jgi:hypothetical protein
MLDGTHYFECRCGSSEHTLRFTLDKDPEDPSIYADVYLNQYRTWWKRFWVGVKYIFGYRCKYGHWDNWILVRSDAQRLRDMCDEFISATQANPQ